MGYLARLLADPGREIPVTAFADAGTQHSIDPLEAFEAGLLASDGTDLGPVLDATAKIAYRERLAELRSEIDEAQQFHDPERASRSRVEHDAILDELASATGLGGRDRRQGSHVERVRLSVTRAIKRAVVRIAEHDRGLGQHFEASVHTGRARVSIAPSEACSALARRETGWIVGRTVRRPEGWKCRRFQPFRPGSAEEACGWFVGREAELGWLVDRWTRPLRAARARPGDGRGWIGKTRLVGEFARRAYQEGALVLHGRCDEDGTAAFQPWVEALDVYAAGCPPAALRLQTLVSGRELTRLLPTLRQRLPELPLPVSGDAVAERYWLFEAVRDFLARMAEKRRVLLVLDDLHWADRPTLLLLRHIVRARVPAPILIVGTYRSDELDGRKQFGGDVSGVAARAAWGSRRVQWPQRDRDGVDDRGLDRHRRRTERGAHALGTDRGAPLFPP